MLVRMAGQGSHFKLVDNLFRLCERNAYYLSLASNDSVNIFNVYLLQHVHFPAIYSTIIMTDDVTQATGCYHLILSHAHQCNYLMFSDCLRQINNSDMYVVAVAIKIIIVVL